MNEGVFIVIAILGVGLAAVWMLGQQPSKPKYNGPSIDEVRAMLSHAKKLLKGAPALKDGVSVYLIVERGSGNTQVVARDEGVPKCEASEYMVEVSVNSRSNCNDLARVAVARLRERYDQ